jgi:hypothetical protein
MQPPFPDLTPGNGNRRGLQPTGSRLQTVIVACTGAAAGESEDSRGRAAMRRDVRKPASRASTIWLAAEISTSASQLVAMPCSGHPFDADGDLMYSESWFALLGMSWGTFLQPIALVFAMMVR